MQYCYVKSHLPRAVHKKTVSSDLAEPHWRRKVKKTDKSLCLLSILLSAGGATEQPTAGQCGLHARRFQARGGAPGGGRHCADLHRCVGLTCPQHPLWRLCFNVCEQYGPLLNMTCAAQEVHPSVADFTNIADNCFAVRVA